MTYTHRHIIAGVSWFFGLPAVGISLLFSGLLPVDQSVGAATISLLWGAGLLGVFGSWAWQDAPQHGKSRYVALSFTMGWILLPFLVVFPYLLLTRGVKEGFASSLQWFCVVIGVLIFFVGVIPWLGRTFF
ncbi:MAG: hypothetical protein C4535_16485 [Comamonadaceae bacterium]|nr:MAG: hypothetical protein C4535_16485 [Comamonadaceae bacterium]